MVDMIRVVKLEMEATSIKELEIAEELSWSKI